MLWNIIWNIVYFFVKWNKVLLGIIDFVVCKISLVRLLIFKVGREERCRLCKGISLIF